MFGRVINATLVFYGIAILKINFVGNAFFIKRYCKNSVTDDFSGTF